MFVAEQFTGDNIPQLVEFINRMLLHIQDQSKFFVDVNLEVLNAEPARARDGMLVRADGTNWNPGSGEGLYAYYNGTWNKL